jgi:hypothetical protein
MPRDGWGVCGALGKDEDRNRLLRDAAAKQDQGRRPRELLKPRMGCQPYQSCLEWDQLDPAENGVTQAVSRSRGQRPGILGSGSAPLVLLRRLSSSMSIVSTTSSSMLRSRCRPHAPGGSATTCHASFGSRRVAPARSRCGWSSVRHLESSLSWPGSSATSKCGSAVVTCAMRPGRRSPTPWRKCSCSWPAVASPKALSRGGLDGLGGP